MLFIGGSVLLLLILKFSVDGCDSIYFFFKGDLYVGEIGLVWVNGCWDGICLCGNVWWFK